MKNAIETLQEQFEISTHYSKYPQDNHRNESVGIKVLLTTSEYYKKLVAEYKLAIDILTAHNK